MTVRSVTQNDLWKQYAVTHGVWSVVVPERVASWDQAGTRIMGQERRQHYVSQRNLYFGKSVAPILISKPFIESIRQCEVSKHSRPVNQMISNSECR